MMSKDALDLINKMIQVDPSERLGHDLESLKELKSHPFFKGVDFEEISRPEYIGNIALVDELKVRIEEKKKELAAKAK
jgi:serine/threonine protein kinase